MGVPYPVFSLRQITVDLAGEKITHFLVTSPTLSDSRRTRSEFDGGSRQTSEHGFPERLAAGSDTAIRDPFVRDRDGCFPTGFIDIATVARLVSGTRSGEKSAMEHVEQARQHRLAR